MFVLSMLPCVQLTMVPRMMIVVVVVVVSSSLLIVPWLKILLSIHCQNCIKRVNAHDMNEKMAVLFELQKNDDFAWTQFSIQNVGILSDQRRTQFKIRRQMLAIPRVRNSYVGVSVILFSRLFELVLRKEKNKTHFSDMFAMYTSRLPVCQQCW